MKPLNILVFFLILANIFFLGILVKDFTGKTVYERVSVNLTRVIDGDTIAIDTGEHVRLLGINTPEKKQPFHDEAMNFLKHWEGKQIEVEEHGKDKYGRILGYIFYNGDLLNKNQLENGYANLYYYGTDKYYSGMKTAEQEARDAGIGLWKKSENFGCIELARLNYIEKERCHNQEQLTLNNRCQEMQIIIKDDANHIYNLNIDNGIFTKNFSCVWNDEGDTMTIRDESGLLLFYRY